MELVVHNPARVTCCDTLPQQFDCFLVGAGAQIERCPQRSGACQFLGVALRSGHLLRLLDQRERPRDIAREAKRGRQVAQANNLSRRVKLAKRLQQLNCLDGMPLVDGPSRIEQPVPAWCNCRRVVVGRSRGRVSPRFCAVF